jgi:hypothetical protein
VACDVALEQADGVAAALMFADRRSFRRLIGACVEAARAVGVPVDGVLDGI